MKFLYPLGLIYGIIVWFRNKLFDFNFLKQTSFNIPVISIGNLSVGGTGKTPHIEYFIRLYQNTYQIAVISRGYGRNTSGFRYVLVNDKAIDVGDEPLQIKQSYENVIVAVDENRVNAIHKVLLEYPLTNLILLDDAFQHRYVKPSLNILITEYSNPFWLNHILPAGRLREFKRGWKRADKIIITKCPETISISIPTAIQTKPIYYSKISYKNIVTAVGTLHANLVLVTGIVNPKPLIEYLKSKQYNIVHHFKFRDHHQFTSDEIKSIINKCGINCTIVTTAKDWVRMKPLITSDNINLAYVPIEIIIEDPPIDWLEK